MLLSQFLDDLLKATREQTIRWTTVEKSADSGFMVIGGNGNLQVDQLIQFNDRKFKVILQPLDNITLVISTVVTKTVEGQEPTEETLQVVLPQHHQSKMKDFVTALYDQIIELQVDKNLFGSLGKQRKLNQLNS